MQHSNISETSANVSETSNNRVIEFKQLQWGQDFACYLEVVATSVNSEFNLSERAKSRNVYSETQR